MPKAKTREVKPETPTRAPDRTPARQPARRKPRTPDKTPARQPDETKTLLARGRLSAAERAKALQDADAIVSKPARRDAKPHATPKPGPLVAGHLSAAARVKAAADVTPVIVEQRPAKPHEQPDPGPLASGRRSIAARRVETSHAPATAIAPRLGGSSIERVTLVGVDPAANPGDIPSKTSDGSIVWSAPGGATGATISGAQATNLTTAKTLNFGGIARELWLVGTLNANLTVTLTNLAAGCRAFLLLTQDGTGTHTLSVNDGSGAQAVAVPSGAGASCVVSVSSPDGTNVYVSPLGVPGATGPAGTNGTNGATGPAGPTGPQGVAGSGITVAGSTTLPSSPVDGQVFSLIVDDTNGIEWQMRWDAAKGLWRCIGGGSLYAFAAAANAGAAIAATTAFAAITGGPSLTLPNVGTSLDVVIEEGGLLSSIIVNLAPIVGIAIAGTALTTNPDTSAVPWLTEWATSSAAIGTRVPSTRLPQRNVAAGAVLTQQLKANIAGNVTLQQLWVSARCVQIHP